MNNQPGMSIERFKKDYEGQPAWDVGKPQEYFVERFTKNCPKSPVLDIGCGTGDLSLFVASLGCEVLGIDFTPKAIQIAKFKSSEKSLNISFKLYDAFEIRNLGLKFGTVLDCCFFHMLDNNARKEYSSVLHDILLPDGKLYMLNYAVALPLPGAPRGVTKSDISNTFKKGWSIIELGSANLYTTFLPNGIPGTFACMELKV